MRDVGLPVLFMMRDGTASLASQSSIHVAVFGFASITISSGKRSEILLALMIEGVKMLAILVAVKSSNSSGIWRFPGFPLGHPDPV